MGKRYIERPTARQIMTAHEREVIREQKRGAYELARDANADWLAANYPEAKPAPATSQSERDHAQMYMGKLWRAFGDLEETNILPAGVKSYEMIRREPESIHSPAPASRFKFERPKKRKAAERNSRDCELPIDMRRHHTLTVTDGRGRHTATITVNPFSKRIGVTGPAFK